MRNIYYIKTNKVKISVEVSDEKIIDIVDLLIRLCIDFEVLREDGTIYFSSGNVEK